MKRSIFSFKWIFSSLQMIEHCIMDKFTTFLNSTYYENVSTRRATRHLFYQNMLDTDLLLQYFQSVGYDKSPIVSPVFNNHDMLDISEYEKFQRPTKCLLDSIESEENIHACFVHYNFYTVQFNSVKNKIK